jgi:phosphoserine phosphatase RsbU/P
MSRWFSLPRPFLAALATVFAVAAVLYASVWMYVERYPDPRVELGFNKLHNEQYDERAHSIKVGDVLQGSPAEQAGLRAGDRIIGVNGRRLSTSAPYYEAYGRGRPGDAVDLTIQRDGDAWPHVLHAIFRASAEGAAPEGLAKTSALEVTRSFPVLFLMVGLAVLFLRVNDSNAWILASLFCGFVATPSFSHPLIMNSALRSFALEYHAVFSGMLCSLFYIFFAVFPACSPLERRFRWLKWASLAFGVGLVLPGLGIGDMRIPGVAEQLVGERAAEMVRTLLVYGTYGLIGLGLLSLGGNAFGRAATPEVRRKSRVILWGTVFGVLPIVIERAAIDLTGYRPSFWFNTLLVIVLALYPLSFAYAVVKHRVMEIPVLLRRSARYVLVQRGFVVLLFVAAVFAITFFTRTFSRFFQPDPNVGMMLSAAFGIALVWLSAPLVKRGTQRIDRAFFRSAYDARVILEDLAEKTRTVTGRTELAALLEQHLNKALRPKTFACYVGTDDSQLIAQSGTVAAGAERLLSDLPFLVQLATRGKSWDVPPSGSDDAEELPVLASLAPECLVPIVDHDGRLSGLLVLGQRLSEEPYSSEDKRLLDSVASQAGIALENICLAEKMAERMEADHRVARDMEIAREVQSRLFPQVMPPVATLDYAGTCIQARVVGGDYYDFLDLGPGRLGIVIADVSGKGIAAALLMGNLQAILRSQYAVALEDPHRLLQSVNRLFYENTLEDRYATVFFGDYDDASRYLRYANCGHNPPLLLRANGELQRLGATATVLGLFKDWKCTVEKVSLRPGDMVLIYTDGITEALNPAEEEFGESRLLEILRSHPQLPVEALLSLILAAVQEFSGANQADDLTLLIAQAR